MLAAAPGPLLFHQERVGRQGRRFVIHKFRTMRADAVAGAHAQHVAALMQSGAPLQKLDARGDARLIPGGWLLRATGLDELPQLLNVLAGDMSVVGPRPCLPYEYEAYTARQRRRFAATPGLTGLWQVSGKNRTTFARMVTLDIVYARRRSLALDLGILLRTPTALLRQLADIRRARRAPLPPAPSAITRTAITPGRTRP
jgi:lipopolysaccharide/colanic/teichoic acid biosynthesis glycosyltransferase